MDTAVALPTWAVAGGSLAVAALVFIAARVLLDRAFSGQGDAVRSVAGPLMPALGAVFALLAALTLSNESAQLRSAEQDIAAESAAASRLAWASTSPGIDPAPIQAALEDYLTVTRAKEWNEPGGEADPAAFRALQVLERRVRTAAAAEAVGSAQAAELYGALDTVSSLRRQRLATRSHQMPAFYLIVVLMSGLALVFNAVALAVDRSRGTSAVAGGLVVVVALVLALLLAITAPFRGGFAVNGRPIDSVVVDLRNGEFVR